ncbi:MAG: hypothetical protein ACK53A_00325 [Gemmatimonadota bacterium]|nr:hypothetical protein [Gemmatimonadota bacterium]
MIGRWPRAAVAVALLAGAAAAGRPLAAQSREDPAIDVTIVSGDPGGGPLVRASGLLADPELEDLLRNGFPARISWRVELWSAGSVVNDFEGGAAWEVLLRFDPVSREWIVTRIERDRTRVLGRFARYAEASASALDGGRVPLPATKPRRHYYLARLTLEVLSLSDLQEAERWLRGGLSPAVRGEKSAGSAIGRFFRAVAARLLGSQRQTVEGRSVTFTP